MPGILILDDEPMALDFMSTLLIHEGYERVYTERESLKLETWLDDPDIGVLLLDLYMPGRDGLDVLDIVRKSRPDIQVLIITGMNDVESAVKCLRAGASDYLVKAEDPNRLITAVRRAVEVRDLERENREFGHRIHEMKVETESPFDYIVTRDARMLELISYLKVVAASSRPMLITGETGTGKELMARAAHEASGRKGSFVPVNVSGYDDSMISDALFGHLPGAFTGAAGSRAGLIEEAALGTLFLDEIGDLSPATQIKLLRLLDSGEYRSVGDDQVKKSRAVIVAATNRALTGSDSEFRQDLYYRLSSHIIHLPQLADRCDDIPILTARFIRDAATEFGMSIPGISDDALQYLRSLSFQGNVRELRSLVFDAVIRSDGVRIHLQDFLKDPHPSSAEGAAIIWPNNLPTLKETGEALVNEALTRTNGNQSAAARLLGISQPALNKRLKKTHETL